MATLPGPDSPLEPSGDRDAPVVSGGARQPFVARRRVEFRDTDAAGIAHFSAFFVWMESAEHEFLRAVGVPLIEQGAPASGEVEAVGGGDSFSWPRVSASCDYVAAVRFGDELDIVVAIEQIGRTSVTWSHRFEHSGRSVARGRMVAVRCLLRPGQRPESVPIPPEVVARLEAFSQ